MQLLINLISFKNYDDADKHEMVGNDDGNNYLMRNLSNTVRVVNIIFLFQLLRNV